MVIEIATNNGVLKLKRLLFWTNKIGNLSEQNAFYFQRLYRVSL